MWSNIKKAYDRHFKGFSLIDLQTEKSRQRSKSINDSLYEGRGFQDRGNYKKALESFDNVLNLDRYNTEAWYQQGMILYYQYYQGDFDSTDISSIALSEILECFEKVTKYSGNPDAWHQKGLILFEQRCYGEALESFVKAIKLGPPSIETLNKEINSIYNIINLDELWSRNTSLFVKEKTYGEVVRFLDKLTKIDTQNADALYKKGVISCGYCKICSDCIELTRGFGFEYYINIALDCFRKSQALDHTTSYDLAFRRYVEPTLLFRLDEFKKIEETGRIHGSRFGRAAYIYKLLGDEENALKYRKKSDEFYANEN